LPYLARLAAEATHLKRPRTTADEAMKLALRRDLILIGE